MPYALSVQIPWHRLPTAAPIESTGIIEDRNSQTPFRSLLLGFQGTYLNVVSISGMCHQPTSAELLNHLIGVREVRRRQTDAPAG